MAPSKLPIDPVLMEAIECLPGGISIFEKEGGPILFNDISRERFPYLYEAFETGAANNYEDAIRYNLRKMSPELTDTEVEELTQYYCDLAASEKPYETRTKDGRVMQVTYRQMSGGRSVAISVDVTELREREIELKKAREEAVAASNAKSAFLANMSHEIRTPLNGILGMAQVLDMGELNNEQHEQVATILDSGRNLMSLLNDILDLSKIEAGKLAMVNTDTDIAHTMRRLHRLWKPKADEAGLSFSLSLDSELPQVMHFDAVRVRQCVSNLISNAIKFTEKGRIDVHVSAQPAADGKSMISIRVTDTGIGMDAETVGRLFTPFVQADDSTSRKFGGTGLGLSIVRRLAEMMGGEAHVESELGRGSTFTFSFLASEARLQHRVASEGAVAGDGDARETLKSKSLRILLVDDHPINRQVAGLFLRPFNMRIVEATNGKEALACLEAEEFDLVLLDIHMPVMDGTQTIKAIRESDKAWKDIPVVALTADAMSGDKERYLEMGMSGYLSKPLSERELVAEIYRMQNLAAENTALPMRKAS